MRNCRRSRWSRVTDGILVYFGRSSRFEFVSLCVCKPTDVFSVGTGESKGDKFWKEIDLES